MLLRTTGRNRTYHVKPPAVVTLQESALTIHTMLDRLKDYVSKPHPPALNFPLTIHTMLDTFKVVVSNSTHIFYKLTNEKGYNSLDL